jgi:hypothetical protein
MSDEEIQSNHHPNRRQLEIDRFLSCISVNGLSSGDVHNYDQSAVVPVSPVPLRTCRRVSKADFKPRASGSNPAKTSNPHIWQESSSIRLSVNPHLILPFFLRPLLCTCPATNSSFFQFSEVFASDFKLCADWRIQRTANDAIPKLDGAAPCEHAAAPRLVRRGLLQGMWGTWEPAYGFEAADWMRLTNFGSYSASAVTLQIAISRRHTED